MKFNMNVLSTYASLAPLALALERTMECRILAKQSFERPILDIGCGEGLFAKCLFAEKIDTGIDPNGRELERARELDVYYELIQCSGDAIPKESGAYRTIMSNSVLEHIKDLKPVLREAHRLLAPGGRFYITVPNQLFERYNWISQILGAAQLTTLQERYCSWFNRFWVHHHTYMPEGWAELMRDCGFTVTEMYTYGPKRVCLTNDALLPFSIPALITKKLSNRWTLVPELRRALLLPATSVTELILKGSERSSTGALVFLAMTRD